jgi:hypothetical protein
VSFPQRTLDVDSGIHGIYDASCFGSDYCTPFARSTASHKSSTKKEPVQTLIGLSIGGTLDWYYLKTAARLKTPPGK